jgi:2-phospho-L-lactate guanylyltransferase
VSTAAVIPVKPISRALGRLGAVLRPMERRELQAAMLADILDACRQSVAVDETFVVTGDRSVGDIARSSGASVLMDHAPPRGMNPAVGIGQGLAEDRLFRTALILTADLPLVRANDLDTVLAALPPGRAAVLVPSRDGSGTNALALSPPFGIATRLGANSRSRHELALLNAGLEVRQLEMPSLALDIDTPDDLAALVMREHGGRAGACCAAWGLADRLAAGAVR